MVSSTPTLLDPFEVTGIHETHETESADLASGPRLRMTTLDEITEWFDRASTLEEIAFLEEISQPPPWSPEPVDVRWRARGWSEDSLD
jgi:hypothetical protein